MLNYYWENTVIFLIISKIAIRKSMVNKYIKTVKFFPNYSILKSKGVLFLILGIQKLRQNIAVMLSETGYFDGNFYRIK